MFLKLITKAKFYHFHSTVFTGNCFDKLNVKNLISFFTKILSITNVAFHIQSKQGKLQSS